MESKLSRNLYITSWLLSIIPFVVYAIAYWFLPNEIPAHKNTYGVVDRWMSKSSIEALLLCSISLIMIGIINPITGFFMKYGGSIKKTYINAVLFCMSVMFVIINIITMYNMWFKLN